MGMTPKKKLNVTFLLFYVSINQINYKNLINKKKPTGIQLMNIHKSLKKPTQGWIRDGKIEKSTFWNHR